MQGGPIVLNFEQLKQLVRPTLLHTIGNPLLFVKIGCPSLLEKIDIAQSVELLCSEAIRLCKGET